LTQRMAECRRRRQDGSRIARKPTVRAVGDGIQTPAPGRSVQTSITLTPPPQVVLREAQRNQSSHDWHLLKLPPLLSTTSTADRWSNSLGSSVSIVGQWPTISSSSALQFDTEPGILFPRWARRKMSTRQPSSDLSSGPVWRSGHGLGPRCRRSRNPMSACNHSDQGLEVWDDQPSLLAAASSDHTGSTKRNSDPAPMSRRVFLPLASNSERLTH